MLMLIILLLIESHFPCNSGASILVPSSLHFGFDHEQEKHKKLRKTKGLRRYSRHLPFAVHFFTLGW
ncbi:MAG: hypothetical protein DLM52_09515 [Chthoniobacterales bacterium]|nr:MAG: hypothetical protein DLM52_09515 [Chthoniobacterales bacterium]